MSELDDINVVRLALGGIFAMSSGAGLNPTVWAKHSEDKTIKERARKMVLRETARMADGEDVGEDMRFVIGVWCRQQLDNGKPGRPDTFVKEEALCLAFYEKMGEDHTRKREAIIAELEKEFGLKRRRVFAILRAHHIIGPRPFRSGRKGHFSGL
jgi:hypothetical protein